MEEKKKVEREGKRREDTGRLTVRERMLRRKRTEMEEKRRRKRRMTARTLVDGRE